MRHLLALLRLIAALAILVATLSALAALLGFAIPVLDILNHFQLLLFFGTLLGLILSLLLGMQGWRIVAALGFAASSWVFVPEWLSSLSPRQPVSDTTTIRVMTHNIFGLNYDIERVARAIGDEDPDIVALQEYFPEQAGLGELLAGKYPYSVRCQGGKRANLGLYSKIPFERAMRAEDCPTNAMGEQRTAHITGFFTLSTGATFTLMTTHMDWPYPTGRQSDQFAATAEAINAIEGPLVVVGDFNSTPWSYAMKGFEAATNLRRESRNLVTYPKLFTLPGGLARLEPFLPLDHVFQRGMIVSELRAGGETGSDHLPVIATFSIAPGG